MPAITKGQRPQNYRRCQQSFCIYFINLLIDTFKEFGIDSDVAGSVDGSQTLFIFIGTAPFSGYKLNGVVVVFFSLRKVMFPFLVGRFQRAIPCSAGQPE